MPVDYAARRQRYATDPEYRDRQRANAKKQYAKRSDEQKTRTRNHQREYMRMWRANPANQEKLRAQKADPEWQERRRKTMRDYHLSAQYGLTRDEYEAMLAGQQSRCAICGRKAEALDVDHCHDTGRVRKLLCSSCNTCLGHMNDDPARLRAAAEYIEQHRSVQDDNQLGAK